MVTKTLRTIKKFWRILLFLIVSANGGTSGLSESKEVTLCSWTLLVVLKIN